MNTTTSTHEMAAFLNDMVANNLLTKQNRMLIEPELAAEPLWREGYVFQFIYRGRSRGIIYSKKQMGKLKQCLVKHNFDKLDRIIESIPTEKRIRDSINRAKKIAANDQ